MSFRIEFTEPRPAPSTRCWCCKQFLGECMCWSNIGPNFMEHCTAEDHAPSVSVSTS